MPDSSVAIGMSGGVDSSVAALLLRERGFRVVGVTLLLEPPAGCRGGSRPCCGDGAARRAERICDALGIEHVTRDCRDIFREIVIGEFIEEYRAGRTPNPCITCNERIKFPQLAIAADGAGCRAIATGHYAGLVRDARGKILLAASPDTGKDQSYFLYRVPVALLERTIFPLERMSKGDVRSAAEKGNLKDVRAGESQDVCFLSGTGLHAFLSEHIAAREGDVVDGRGGLLGRHSGTHGYTIGQRRGLGVSADMPLYVTSIDAERNLVRLGPDEELYGSTAVCRSVRMRYRTIDGPLRAKIRYRHEPAEVARLERKDGMLRVRFKEPQRAVTPGQSLVLYRDGVIVGGGVISSSGT